MVRLAPKQTPTSANDRERLEPIPLPYAQRDMDSPNINPNQKNYILSNNIFKAVSLWPLKTETQNRSHKIPYKIYGVLVVLGQVSLRAPPFPAVCIISPTLHSRISLIYLRRYTG
jgi:hypothetical protein